MINLKSILTHLRKMPKYFYKTRKFYEKLFMNNKIFEWAGVITAILYSLFVAMNIGVEFFGFCLLLISAILIGIWAYRGGHRGILFLQFFYATAGIIGMFRWF